MLHASKLTVPPVMRTPAPCEQQARCMKGEHPIGAPMGCSLFMQYVCCSQGGGILIYGGTVNIQDTSIYSNSAFGVSACFVNP